MRGCLRRLPTSCDDRSGAEQPVERPAGAAPRTRRIRSGAVRQEHERVRASAMTRAQSEQDGQDGFVRRAAWLTMANSIAFVLSFISPLLLVRMLSQTEFGVYKQAFQILISTIAALNLQVASTGYYFMPRAPEKKLQVTFNVLAFYGGLGALTGALFIFYPECALLVFASRGLVTHMPLPRDAILP